MHSGVNWLRCTSLSRSTPPQIDGKSPSDRVRGRGRHSHASRAVAEVVYSPPLGGVASSAVTAGLLSESRTRKFRTLSCPQEMAQWLKEEAFGQEASTLPVCRAYKA